MKPVREWMRDRRVAGVLAALALLFVAYRVVKSVRPAQPPAGQGSEPATSPAPPEPLPVALAPVPSPPPAEFPPGWSGPAWTWDRNPFLPPSRERARGKAGGGRNGGEGRPPDAAGTDGFVPELRGTVVSRESSMAIFRSHRPDGGGRLVPVGGTIGEWTLLKVEPYRVSLRKGSETRVLELYRQ